MFFLLIPLLSWFHGDLSRHAAEALLLSNGTDGSYLLRNGNAGLGCFALSVRWVFLLKIFLEPTLKRADYRLGSCTVVSSITVTMGSFDKSLDDVPLLTKIDNNKIKLNMLVVMYIYHFLHIGQRIRSSIFM